MKPTHPPDPNTRRLDRNSLDPKANGLYFNATSPNLKANGVTLQSPVSRSAHGVGKSSVSKPHRGYPTCASRRWALELNRVAVSFRIGGETT